MFDVSASELMLTVIVAIVVIGPKDLPLALRTAGRWIGKIRRVSNHFRSGIETMIREAELEEMEKKWREQNAAIMASHPNADATPEAEASAAAHAAQGLLPEPEAAPTQPATPATPAAATPASATPAAAAAEAAGAHDPHG